MQLATSVLSVLQSGEGKGRERKREREGEREMECPRGKREQREPGSSIDRLLSSSIPATEP